MREKSQRAAVRKTIGHMWSCVLSSEPAHLCYEDFVSCDVCPKLNPARSAEKSNIKILHQ